MPRSPVHKHRKFSAVFLASLTKSSMTILPNSLPTMLMSKKQRGRVPRHTSASILSLYKPSLSNIFLKTGKFFLSACTWRSLASSNLARTSLFRGSSLQASLRSSSAHSNSSSSIRAQPRRYSAFTFCLVRSSTAVQHVSASRGLPPLSAACASLSRSVSMSSCRSFSQPSATWHSTSLSTIMRESLYLSCATSHCCISYICLA
mmetsp:Transcript_55953/g.92562  ORF Transcript_55953/g.92562 Transcript_55953/m.92562 type:complete len:204 (-) Transcript_55953:1974-2585(-)